MQPSHFPTELVSALMIRGFFEPLIPCFFTAKATKIVRRGWRVQGGTTVRWACLFRANHLHGRPTAANDHRQKDERTGGWSGDTLHWPPSLFPSLLLHYDAASRKAGEKYRGRTSAHRGGGFLPRFLVLALACKE